jgi:hypothetical protein
MKSDSLFEIDIFGSDSSDSSDDSSVVSHVEKELEARAFPVVVWSMPAKELSPVLGTLSVRGTLRIMVTLWTLFIGRRLNKSKRRIVSKVRRRSAGGHCRPPSIHQPSVLRECQVESAEALLPGPNE